MEYLAIFFRSYFLLLMMLVSLASAWDINNDNDRHRCQLPSRNPLEGCDSGKTRYVDVGGNSSDFQTVQSGASSQEITIKVSVKLKYCYLAVLSLPNNTGMSIGH